jgi:GNAT superfamily N-acetyltransferase
MHPQTLPQLREWFEDEWPSYYGAEGPGDAQLDLQSFANLDSLPLGLLAFQQGALCGIAALKASSISSHAHLSPWAAAGLVKPSERGKGIGAQLIGALEGQARNMGFGYIYCATSTANSLLERCEWKLVEHTLHDGQELGVYRKTLRQLIQAEPTSGFN